MYILDK